MTAAPLRNRSQRPTRTSLVDALDVLNVMAVHPDADLKILTAPWLLPDGRRTGLVQIYAHEPSGTVRRLPMPSAHGFSAKTTLGRLIEREIDALDEARFDRDGNVTLADGSHLHDVKLHPTPLTFELTALQKYILHLTIVYLGAEKTCYRPLAPELPIVVLDYAALQKCAVKNLKPLQRHIFQAGLRVSHQEIADTLAAAGVRLPRSGRHSAKAHATFLM